MSDILNITEIEHFIQNGFIRIDHAFSQEIADEVLDILWKEIPFERSNPTTWTEPVVWLGMYSQPPFVKSLNTAKLHSIYNQLVGKDRWIPCQSVGAFPVRFPTTRQSNDTGKHVDAGFPGNDPNNYFEWRVNIKSKGRALLMLALYSDVSENDAPTVIYEGSHMDIARLLADKGEEGLSFLQIANESDNLPERKKVFATGKAGTVYLCHPFLIHSAQSHKGTVPRFMAQPPLFLKGELNISNANDYSPVEQAIRLALD
ncbi:hypothetical protein [Chryseobacterium lathyri]|uniref:hypothetical protein n=1 Tax=Chryseobacterium lathyri TaxID=395933 RepID=UPI002788D897|nr:hypothetical protein [Chryseobacterium lathyri]MDQ0068160.1 hypothetical protein [Chryseobacterium lathyri]